MKPRTIMVYLVIFAAGLGAGHFATVTDQPLLTTTDTATARTSCESQQLPKFDTAPVRSSTPACQCDTPSDCGNADQTGSITDFYQQLLDAGEFEQAQTLFNSVWDQSPAKVAPLKQHLIRKLELLVKFPSEYLFVSDLYLESYYDDNQILLLRANFLSQQASFFEALNTLQLAKNYGYSPKELGQTDGTVTDIYQQIETYFDLDSQAQNVITLFEHGREIDVLTERELYRLAELYLYTGNISAARDIANEVDRFSSAWQQQFKKLFASSDRTPSKPIAQPSTTYSIPLTRHANQFIVDVKLNEQPASLLIDTGASITALTEEHFNQNLAKLKPQLIGIQRFRTANGITDSQIFLVRNFQIGRYNLEDIHVAVMNFPSDDNIHGLLGMNVLQQFDFDVDQRKSRLNLEFENR